MRFLLRLPLIVILAGIGALAMIMPGLYAHALDQHKIGSIFLGCAGLFLLLAVITAVISNYTLILAVQRIGSTLTSVLGVLEPVTAVIVGILVFKEPFSLPLLLGIVLIAASVVLIMLGGHIRLLLARRKAAKLDIPPSS